MLRIFQWLGWKGGLPACVLLPALAASVYFWIYITLDTTCPGYWAERRWYGAAGAASAHFFIREWTFIGCFLGAILDLFFWRRRLAGAKYERLVCILLPAMVMSVYFKALAILDTQQPTYWARQPFGESDYTIDVANFGIVIQTFFGFCLGAILGLLLWRLLVRLQ